MAKMAKTFFLLFLCIASLQYIVQSAFVLNQRLKPRNPFAKSEIVEGDILVMQSSRDIFYKRMGIKFQASASIIHDSNLWTNGIVPYELDPEVKEHKCLIEAAMAHIVLQSCVYFRPKQEGDRHYVQIVKNRDNVCAATVGRCNSGNEITLGDGCYHFGTIIHELMHVLGFHHEHARHDRDNYLRVHYENVKLDLKDKKLNFDPKDESVERIITVFDHDSIMMYGPTDFGIDEKVTIESLVPGKVLGQRKGLSRLDVQSISTLYKCESTLNLVCTKFAQTLIHLKNCHCETGEHVDLNLLKPLYQSCKRVLKK